METNEGFVRAAQARTKQANSDARSNSPGTPGKQGATAASVDPSGMAASDVKAFNKIFLDTTRALTTQGKRDETKEQRIAADTARLTWALRKDSG